MYLQMSFIFLNTHYFYSKPHEILLGKVLLLLYLKYTERNLRYIENYIFLSIETSYLYCSF